MDITNKKNHVKPGKIIKALMVAVVLLYIIPILVYKQYETIEIKVDDPDYQKHCLVQISGFY